MSVVVLIFMIFDDSWTPFRGVFWDTNVNKWSMEKQTKKESEIVMQAIRNLTESYQ